MVRPSPSALFLCGAVVLTAAIGIAAKTASGSEDRASALPSDAARLGFLPVGAPVQGVILLDATQPFRLELTHGPIIGMPPQGPTLARARAIVRRELARYPRSFLAAAHFKGVVFTDDLREGETSIPSLPNVAGLLLLDVNGGENDLVRGFHHEVFHFADLADDNSVSPDPAWEELNRKGFAYGAGGRTLRAAWAAAPPEEDGFVSGGFVSSYATSGVEEDKAETFAFAVARPAEVRARAARDAVVAAKLSEVAQRVGKLDPDAPRVLGLMR